MLDNDVSLHDLVILVAVIPTSPRISKTEFVCKRYHVFRMCVSEILSDSEFSELIPDRMFSSQNTFKNSPEASCFLFRIFRTTRNSEPNPDSFQTTRICTKRSDFGDLYNGAFFPNGSLTLELVFPPLLNLFELCYLSIPP